MRVADVVAGDESEHRSLMPDVADSVTFDAHGATLYRGADRI
jgi:hypothetical protein